MKNISLKLLVISTVALTSACSGSGFPSLFDGADNGNIVVRSGSYEDAKGANTGTFVGQKVIAFRQELQQISVSNQSNGEEFSRISKNIAANATQYNNTIGSVNEKLQIGTTPGNPNLYNMLQQAQNNVQTMSMNANALNNLSVKIANNATSTAYLIDSVRAAFNISGAVDEDHRQLRILQNEAEQLLVSVNSLGGQVNNDAARQQEYLISAQNQIARLNDAVRVGSFAGAAPTSVARPAAPVAAPRPALFGSASANVPATTTAKTSATPAFMNGKPLFVAKFNRDNVSYKEGLSTAVKAAVKRKSNTVFEVVAVADGASTAKAREHATRIFEEIAAMGVSPNNINLGAKTDNRTTGAEVWIFVR